MGPDRVVRSQICPPGGPPKSIPSLPGVLRDPDSLDAKLDAYDGYQGKAIAWCLLCNGPIIDEADLISKKHVIHNCRKGRALAAVIGTETIRAVPKPAGARK